MVLTIATKITIARILAVPAFVILLLYYSNSVLQRAPNYMFRLGATLFFLGIFLFDALDGYIARSRNQITRLGTLLDPLADKALLLSAIIILNQSPETAFDPRIPLWFVITVISRDLMLILGAAVIHLITGTVEIRPRVIGKMATFFQMMVVVWVLLGCAGRAFPWLLGGATLCILGSLAHYIYDGIKQLEKE
jgi:cardiolipin synthase